jgi:hypothetical protein
MKAGMGLRKSLNGDVPEAGAPMVVGVNEKSHV